MFKDTDILQKLFVNVTHKGVVKNKSVDNLDINSTIFLKNKYLYLYGEGASYYLQARQSMAESKKELDDLEEEVLIKFLSDKLNNLRLVSLGSANATKETNALLKLDSDKCLPFTFIPVDVSASLIQLAVLYFYQSFNGKTYAKIKPIIGDIWDLQNHKIELFPDESNNNSAIEKVFTVFTLLGSTISNYKESELFSTIIKLMNTDDFLVLGCDIIFDKNRIDQENDIYEKYSTLGNIQFMLNPLNYIPKFRGYIERFDKYFRLDKKSSIVTSYQRERYNQLTDVASSICYAPLLELPKEIIEEEIQADRVKMSVAQSTKYSYISLIRFFEEFKDESNGITHKFEIDNEYTKNRPTAACIVLKKIIETSESDLDKKLRTHMVALKDKESSTPNNINFATKFLATKGLDHEIKKCICKVVERHQVGVDLPYMILNIMEQK
ncbi:MAG TPA: L-histidine N(alpha)-methyltransferase [Ignavibacteriaceae bacterium]|nr:L-histidine N(alpha)-methyltransferase [Ignavibacteriaceae bacterium]